VAKLQKLPPEIGHQILNKLPLFKVLNLLAHKTPYVMKCAIGHCHLGRLFQSSADIASVIDSFLLLRDMRVFLRGKMRDNILAFNYSMIRPRLQFNISDLHFGLVDVIGSHLRLEPLDIEILRPYACGDYPASLDSSFANLLNQWLWVKPAKEKINIVKAGQWNKVADLLMTSPGNYMLKKPLDISQAGPTPKVAHVINTFRWNAK
jgi:hypothetical protein